MTSKGCTVMQWLYWRHFANFDYMYVEKKLFVLIIDTVVNKSTANSLLRDTPFYVSVLVGTLCAFTMWNFCL